MTLNTSGNTKMPATGTQPFFSTSAPMAQKAPTAAKPYRAIALRMRTAAVYLIAAMALGWPVGGNSVAPVVAAQQGTVSPVARQQFFDNNGNPLSGGKLYTYAAGTTTPLATYTDVGLTVANTNPVILDSAGRTPSGLYLSAASYKYVLTTSANVTLWTQDNVTSVALAGSSIGLTVKPFFGDATVPVTATSYPSGATYSALHSGTLIFAINSANLVGTYALEGMLMAVGGGTVSAVIVNLSDGSPDTPLATISSTSSTGERQQSSTITFGAAGSLKNYGIKVKVTSGTGFVWGLTLLRTT